MKQQLRKKLQERRDNIKDRIEKSKSIHKQLNLIPQYSLAKTVMFYVSFKSEVDTHELIKQNLKTKTIVIPKVKDNKLILCKIDNFNNLQLGQYGILEPKIIKKIDKDQLDVIIVPGIAFDKKGYRLGYGKGYYDQLLDETNALKIGLTFEGLVEQDLPTEEHDIPVDIIVTEKRIRKI